MEYSRYIHLPVPPEKETEKNKNIRNIYFGLPEASILLHHGKQFVPDLKNAVLTERFRGRPELCADLAAEEMNFLVDLCPVQAFEKEKFCLNLGKCVFCKECHFALPDKVVFTNDYKMATNDPEKLKIFPGQKEPIGFNDALRRKEIKKLFRKSLKLRQVSAAGDNSCEMELNAAGNVNFDMGRYGIEFVASPRHSDGIVITGPVSENMARALQITWDAVPSPKICIVVGTDAISGGIFSAGNALDRRFFDLVKPDLYVPGNPAHPLTFINGVLELIGR